MKLKLTHYYFKFSFSFFFFVYVVLSMCYKKGACAGKTTTTHNQGEKIINRGEEKMRGRGKN